MKRYRFRLEQVLRVRRVQEEQARQRVHNAQRDIHLADEKVQARLDAYDAAAASTTVASADRNAFMAQRSLGELRAQAVEMSRGDASAARDVHATRVTEWSMEAQRVEALERLDVRRRDEYAIEERRDEDRVVDDLVSGRHMRRSRP
jgi:flagellar export protein FliJ